MSQRQTNAVEPLESRRLMSAALPAVFNVDAADLAQTKVDLAKGDKTLKTALASLVSAANKDLKLTPGSVTDHANPSGISAHDYVSYARYWWPNPKTKSGLPYIRIDGKVNSAQVKKGDVSAIDQMLASARALSVAYYLTGKEAYAAGATKVIEAWFLNSKTKMNPNLNHAQIELGDNSGSGDGILDAREIGDVTDAIGLLKGSAAWSKSDTSGMNDWFTSYADWLTTSSNGRSVQAASNNQGTWYDVQLMSVLLFLGQTSDAKSLAKSFETNRIAQQVTSSGSQPAELSRADGWKYSLFNLTAMFQMATLAENVGVNLWTYTASSGGSIRQAIDYVAPYADSGKAWTHSHVGTINRNDLAPLLIQAKSIYGSAFNKYLADLSSSTVTKNVENLFVDA